LVISVVAEIAQQHDGSLGQFHAYIDAVAAAGADAIKGQCHLAQYESTKDEAWRVKFSQQDTARYDYWKRMEFTRDQWAALSEHARLLGLEFIVSPFSVEAVEMLDGLVDRWKVASGEVTNSPLLTALYQTHQPIVLSSGMSTVLELDHVTTMFDRSPPGLTVLQCTSRYPCPPEQIGLNLMAFGSYDGLSDHSGSIYTGLAAVALGAQMLEVHVCFSKEEFGPDVSSSITISELKQLVEGVRWIERIIENPVDKDAMAEEMAPMKALFEKSIAVTEPVRKGYVVHCLGARKPGTGIPASRMAEFQGKVAARDIEAGTLLKEEDVVWPSS
jgi:N-acetylneuraminate synthase